jgi:hypothetical protein
VYVGELLEPGMRLAGPAIIETSRSTVVVHPGNEVSIDDYGNVLIELDAAWRPDLGGEVAARVTPEEEEVGS